MPAVMGLSRPMGVSFCDEAGTVCPAWARPLVAAAIPQAPAAPAVNFRNSRLSIVMECLPSIGDIKRRDFIAVGEMASNLDLTGSPALVYMNPFGLSRHD